MGFIDLPTVQGHSHGAYDGLLIFGDAEELDFAGPWEVLATMAQGSGDRVLLIAEHERSVTCAKGMRVLPDCTFADAPPLDVVLVPGGMGTRREVSNPDQAGRCSRRPYPLHALAPPDHRTGWAGRERKLS